jgi:replication factor A3
VEYAIDRASQDCHLSVGRAVEIIGKVDQNLNVKVQAATDFGTNIGMSWCSGTPEAIARGGPGGRGTCSKQ